MFNFENLNLDTLQPFQDIFPDGWFDDVRQLYGEGLSDEMISQSVEETCDFFHIEEPAIVYEGGKWIRVDGSGTVNIKGVKYDKV